jgi:Fur family peroxide stress response transcriptional regulator
MLDRLRASGLKLTPQRIAIVRELAADLSHPTAQELYERLRVSMPTMSFATVYNTLDALAAEGLCVARSFEPGATRFDPNTEPHHHAVCDRCGVVLDLPHRAVERSLGGRSSATLLPAARGFSVRAVERIYRGLCATCQSRAAPPSSRGARAP